MNRYCPHCGSDKMTVDVDITITGTLDKDGKVRVKPIWDETELQEAIEESSCHDMRGFCDECGKSCGFDWLNGFTEEED